MASQKPFKIVVLISGNGSNLQAIIDAINSGHLDARICAVISNRGGVQGLLRAEQNRIPTHVIEHKQFPDRESFDAVLATTIDQYEPDLVVLAGFMRILTDKFVQHYAGKMINIHPSLLPKYQGLNTHARVLAANEEEHGATVHFVVPELDNGPIILQKSIPVLPHDTADSLKQRVHEVEHQIYPEAIRQIALGQVRFSKGKVNC